MDLLQIQIANNGWLVSYNLGKDKDYRHVYNVFEELDGALGFIKNFNFVRA